MRSHELFPICKRTTHSFGIISTQILQKMVAFRSIGVNYMTPRYDFTRIFKTSVPNNEISKSGVTHPIKDSRQIYTDGSKPNEAVGSGVFSKSE